MAGKVGDVRVLVGSAGLLDAAGIPPPTEGVAARMAAAAASVAWVAFDGRVAGALLLADRILNRKPAVGIVHDLDLFARQTAREGCRLQDQHHPVVMQGQVLRDGPFLPPGQDLVQIVPRGQLPVQVLGVRRFTAKARL